MMFNLQACNRGCAKGLLLVLNCLCVMTALSLVAFAIVDANILKQYGEEKATGSFIRDIIIAVACLVLVIVACFGAFGAARENMKILYLYIGLLLMLVSLELLITIYVSVQRFGLEFRVIDWLREDFFKNVTSDDLEHQQLWGDLESSYECCGLNGPEDYTALQKPINIACCQKAYRARGDFARDKLYSSCIETSSYYPKGCEEEVLYALREGSDCLLGVTVMVFWFETAGMLLALWMANNLKNDQVYKICY